MKNYFKNITIRGVINWVFAIVIGFLVVKDVLRKHDFQKQLEQARRDSRGDTTKSSIEAKKIAEEVNIKGDTVVIFERAEPIIKTLELKVEDKRKVDSLLRISDIKDGRLKNLSVLYAEANARNLELAQRIDENGRDTVWEYKDKYITNTIYRTDTSFKSDIWLDATVSKIDYTKKKSWFFGRDHALTKVWFNSPYIKPSGMDALEIKQKEPFFGWGVNVEGRYLHNSREMIVSPRMNIKLGRINLVGGWGLNTNTGVAMPWYGVDYRIK